MAVYFNGTKLDVAVINGLQLTDIYVNNILVYSEESEFNIEIRSYFYVDNFSNVHLLNNVTFTWTKGRFANASANVVLNYTYRTYQGGSTIESIKLSDPIATSITCSSKTDRTVPFTYTKSSDIDFRIGKWAFPNNTVPVKGFIPSITSLKLLYTNRFGTVREYDISLSGLVETSFSTSPVLTVTKTVSSN